MTNELERLTILATALAPAAAITQNELGFTLATADAELDFFSPTGAPSVVYCRACVGNLGEATLPASFAEGALMGNFFWRATEGATLSLNEAENAIYLTDRFDEGAFKDAAALENYANDFLRTLYDWRERLNTSLDAKEVRQ